jgi:prevent-host-death family protein
MRKTSLAKAKAHLSALVDAAEHKKTSTLILRHGRPSAAIVPVDVAVGARSKRGTRRPLLKAAAIRRLFERLGKGDPHRSALEDLLDGRR